MSSDNSIDQITIYKVMSISSSHQLALPYDSKCNRIHGHNFKFEVWITGSLSEYGMVMDFHKIKSMVTDLDHRHLNDILSHPTAENLALFFMNKIQSLKHQNLTKIKVRVWETDTAYAECES